MTAFRPCKASSTQWVEQLALGLHTPALPAPDLLPSAPVASRWGWWSCSWDTRLCTSSYLLCSTSPSWLSHLFLFFCAKFSPYSGKLKNGRESCPGSEPDFRQFSYWKHCGPLLCSWVTSAFPVMTDCSLPSDRCRLNPYHLLIRGTFHQWRSPLAARWWLSEQEF